MLYLFDDLFVMSGNIGIEIVKRGLNNNLTKRHL